MRLDEVRRLESPLKITPLDLDMVAAFLQRNPRVVIVTGVKRDNLAALRKIAQRIEANERRVVPQAYEPSEVGKALEMVSRALELRQRYDDALLAVAMPVAVVEDGTAARLADHGISSYAHTINGRSEYQRLRELGVTSIYTDEPSLADCR
ncbi:MAG: hypothetical protein EA384_08640 [Spirochaetaceae bacterium]|nr:MAG: hypothetical protein EA384_08640 [Spirochaetaceae bacterium]